MAWRNCRLLDCAMELLTRAAAGEPSTEKSPDWKAQQVGPTALPSCPPVAVTRGLMGTFPQVSEALVARPFSAIVGLERGQPFLLLHRRLHLRDRLLGRGQHLGGVGQVREPL